MFHFFESIPPPQGCMPYKNNFYMSDQQPNHEVPGPNRGQVTALLDLILVIYTYFCYSRQVPMTHIFVWKVHHLNSVHILTLFLRSILILSTQVHNVLSTLQVPD
jgi:hypothetical protein